MLNSIRKFSSSPYAKVLLGIVILPFILWGMGDVFRGGKQNTIVEINGKKISTQEFGDYINTLNLGYEEIDNKTFNTALSNFIAKNLVKTDANRLKINITDNSLAKMIQNNARFKKNEKFSRTKYEKFLITSNYTAYQFEKYLKEEGTKDQLLNFISGGIKSPYFLINQEYNSSNQIRNILSIDLNQVYKNKLIISDSQIKNYYEKNLDKFSENFKSVRYCKITPKAITGKEEFSNLFYDALDNIEDSIASELDLNAISKKFGLPMIQTNSFNTSGKTKNGERFSDFSSKIIKKIFEINETDSVVLIGQDEKYLLISIDKNESVPKNISSDEVISEISSILRSKITTEENSKIIKEIITNKFKKSDFDHLANNNNIQINKITINGVGDTKMLGKEITKNIYLFPEKKIYVFTDINSNKNILVYIHEIKHVKIDLNSDNYKKYSDQTKNKLITGIYKTYDQYINNKYNVSINSNAVERVKNFFK